jgi:hypothetical protein
MQDQNVADEIVRGYREGDRNWQAEGDRQYSQEYGLGGFDRGPGRSDLDYRRRIQEQQGFIRTPQGMVPIGPQITPERIESVRSFDEWANENPGTERQARYAPEDYEKFREGVRNDIRDNARQDMATYGTGSDEQLKDAIERGNRTAGEQYKKRQERKASEERVRNAQRGRFYEERLRADAGLAPQSLGPNPTIDQLERAAYTQRYTKRQRELEARKQNRIDQAMMAGGQPTGGPFGTRATTTAINQLGPGWREIALLDRLTNGRVGGPTPLGVDAMGAQNAFRMMQGMGLGEGLFTTPAMQQQVQQAQLQQQAAVIQDAEDHVNENYAYDASHSFGSPFELAEQQATVDYLMNKYGEPAGRMTLAQAQAIVDNIATRKRKPAAAPPAAPPAAGPPAGGGSGLPPPGGRAPL